MSSHPLVWSPAPHEVGTGLVHPLTSVPSMVWPVQTEGRWHRSPWSPRSSETKLTEQLRGPLDAPPSGYLGDEVLL